MAKIVLVSEKLNSTSWTLARALRAQAHEVIILTSQSEQDFTDQDANTVVMRFFKKWNLLEAVQVIPAILSLNPQIVHILLESDQMNIAQSSLALFAKGHPGCILTTSLLHIRRGLHKRNPVRYLMQESDIITCPTVESMGHLRGLSAHKSQGRGILPPILDINDEAKKSPQEVDISELPLLEMLQNRNYVIIPFQELEFNPDSAYFQRLKIWAGRYHVVLWGSFQSWPVRQRKQFANWMQDLSLETQWTVTGYISRGSTEELLEKAQALVLAGQHFTPIEMTEFYLKAIQTHCTLVLGQKQAQVHAALWKNGKNCWILNERKLDLELIALLHQEDLKTSESLPESIARERHWIDVPLNDLNRLYNKALMSK